MNDSSGLSETQDENVVEEIKPVRIQKLLANSGIGSRRTVEEMIVAGRIFVNGEMATLGDKATSADEITIDSQSVDLAVQYKTYLLNKPLGVISTSSDENDRKTVVDLIESDLRLYTVGRLDADTTGLILVSNDGDLTHKLTHPKYGVEKKYIAQLTGEITEEALDTLRNGVELEDGMTAPSKVRLLGCKTGESLVEIVIHEGRNRQIRRMAQAVGFPVISLTRTKIANLEDRSLKPGEYRELTLSEIQDLKVASQERWPDRLGYSHDIFSHPRCNHL